MWFGWSSRVLFPAANTDESLSKVSLPSAPGSAGRDRSAGAAGVSSGSLRSLPMLIRPLEIAIAPAQRAADEEAASEHLPHVAHLVEIVPDEAGPHRVVVGLEAGRPGR